MVNNAVKIFDGQTLEDFVTLPDDGMQGMVLAFPDATRRIINGCDWYWADHSINGPLYGQGSSPEYSSVADVLARYPTASVKCGRYIDDATVNALTRDMSNWEPYAIEITR